jgi:hypothetical protein
MEWWSNGVMKKPIQVEIRVFAFANTPILQYSSTPIDSLFHRQSLSTLTWRRGPDLFG